MYQPLDINLIKNNPSPINHLSANNYTLLALWCGVGVKNPKKKL